MCAFCGPLPSSPVWFDAGIPDGLAARLRARESVLRVAHEVVDPRTARVTAQPGSVAITVMTPDGRTAAVTDYGDLWATIDALAARPVSAVGGKPVGGTL